MDRPTVSPGRLLAATMALTLPAGAVLAAGVAAGFLTPLHGLMGYVAVLVLTLPLLRPHLADVAAVNRWTRSLAQGADADPPVLRRRPLDDAVAAIAQLRRGWQNDRAALAASARWHEAVFDSLPDPLVLIAESRRVVRLNNAARAAFGRDITGRDLAAILRDPAVLEATDAVLAGEAGRETEFALPVPVERNFIARVERLDGAPAEGTTAILALHDITTVRRLEQMRADFVANASHELRTPLSTLLGFIETLRGPARDDSQAREQFLGIMFEQASRMARLINDLLSLSRIELNEHSPPSDRVDLVEILDTAILAMQPLAAAKTMTLVRRFERDSATVLGQPDELAQLVQNLLDNALKYGREGTPVEVVLRSAERLPPAAAHLRLGASVALTVTDRGEGIPREHLPRLTERFYRIDTARSRKLGGTGLGLAIVKHIINRHRGALAIDSVLGQGSSFTVYLPLAAEN
ncbi:MAG: ATP-binding protein [Magnetospirillum sp.]|nr:ATP-binding protein [Magnetospirillum sp.]